MLRSLRLVPFVTLALAGPGMGATPERETGRPHLELRATPRAAFSPAEVTVMGRLVGGEDLEEFYCPAFEWEWGDGGRSTRESDCPPFDQETRMARRFTVMHRYREAGEFSVRLTLRRGGRVVAVATASIRILGRGDDEGSPASGLSSLLTGAGSR